MANLLNNYLNDAIMQLNHFKVNMLSYSQRRYTSIFDLPVWKKQCFICEAAEESTVAFALADIQAYRYRHRDLTPVCQVLVRRHRNI